MPTYDYRCDGCNHEFELFQGIKEPVKRKCPQCGRLKLRRLFGIGAAVMFKGSGFYTTDYRSDSYKKRAAEDSKSSESKPAEGKSEAKSESKPEGSSGASKESKSAKKKDKS